MAEAGECREWLGAVASTRQSSSEPTTLIARDRDPQGRTRLTLVMPPPEASSAAVAAVLLAAFVEATASGARTTGAQQQGLLPRGIEIVAPLPAAAPAASAADPDVDGEQQDPTATSAPLLVQFTATDPAAEEQVEEAARLFEAYWQYHIKAAKSDLHCRMRQHLTALRQQLMLTEFNGL